MLAKFSKYYHTLKFLKPTQIRYQFWYRFKRKWDKGIPFGKTYDFSVLDVEEITWIESALPPTNSYHGNRIFEFLNLKKEFNNGIDWNEVSHGKLWTYNLTYFEYLLQMNVPFQEKLELIRDFIQQKKQVKDGFEPYPISLRSIFWIRFMIENEHKDEEMNLLLYQQLQYLSQYIEYHLLGNHLLENGFAFLFGAVYFQDKQFQKLAERILKDELTEQILADGAHFELSPMYHQIILYRLLDSINLLKGTKHRFANAFVEFCEIKAKDMLGWMMNISEPIGVMPMLNDATNGIAPDYHSLSDYASRLGLEANRKPLGASGYRLMQEREWVVIADIGPIGPDYIPGHAHADSLAFELYHQQSPIFIDTGISTYEKNARRQEERSTPSHNTVTVQDADSSQVWGGFRVAKRAETQVQKDQPEHIKASHNGYRTYGVTHSREWVLDSSGLSITDEITGSNNVSSFACFNVPKSVKVTRTKEYIQVGTLKMRFKGDICTRIDDYQYCLGYHQLETGKQLRVEFANRLETILFE